MTDRLVDPAFVSARTNISSRLGGGVLDLDAAPLQAERRIAELERDLAEIRARLHLSKQAQARHVARDAKQRMLARDLAHRLKNSLALVQAMVRQTLREPVSANAARESLTARIVALGQAQGLLIEKRHSGASVGRIVEAAFAPHADAGADRLRLVGPPVCLAPGQALALSMAMHELATNAVKYGALSVEGGRVEVAWQTSRAGGRRQFSLRWSEHDGPGVTPPTCRGFGSRLIERALAAAFGGKVELKPEPTGMVCRVTAVMQPVRRPDQAAFRASRKAACSATSSPPSAFPINTRVSGTP